MKKFFIIFGFLLFFVSINDTVKAQLGIGASYEIRDKSPDNGFGVRLEKGILPELPLLDLGIRAHFSYFNDKNNINREGVSFSRKIDMYDYGLAVIGGVKLGLVKPYVGLGVGNQQFKFDADVKEFSFDESSFYWNAFGGAEFTIIQVLNPFIEYRITNLTNTKDIKADNISRLAIGVILRF